MWQLMFVWVLLSSFTVYTVAAYPWEEKNKGLQVGNIANGAGSGKPKFKSSLMGEPYMLPELFGRRDGDDDY